MKTEKKYPLDDKTREMRSDVLRYMIETPPLNHNMTPEELKQHGFRCEDDNIPTRK